MSTATTYRRVGRTSTLGDGPPPEANAQPFARPAVPKDAPNAPATKGYPVSAGIIPLRRVLYRRLDGVSASADGAARCGRLLGESFELLVEVREHR
jgi:hypothetical protein